MKLQLYTFNEIVDTLRRISRDEDSLTAVLRAGDFRYRFETYVSESRAKRDTGNILTLADRLVSTTQNGKDVFILDDIQGAVTKKQFAKFMQFIKDHPVDIRIDEITYIPTDVVDLFVQGEQHLISLEDAAEDEAITGTEDDQSSLRFV